MNLNALLFIGLMFAWVSSSTAEITHISVDQVANLKTEFAVAKPIAEAASLDQSQWDCSLFGVRSRMQKEKNIHLFKFAMANRGTIKNTGAHMFDRYSQVSGELVATNPSKGLKETLRLIDTDNIIAHLELNRASKKEANSLAFAKCKRLKK